jgi:hypothetical protein
MARADAYIYKNHSGIITASLELRREEGGGGKEIEEKKPKSVAGSEQACQHVSSSGNLAGPAQCHKADTFARQPIEFHAFQCICKNKGNADIRMGLSCPSCCNITRLGFERPESLAMCSQKKLNL